MTDQRLFDMTSDQVASIGQRFDRIGSAIEIITSTIEILITNCSHGS